MAILYPVLTDMRDTTEVRKSLLSFDQEFRNVVLTIEGLIERVDSKTTFENLTVTNTLTVGVRVVAPVLNAPTTLQLQTGGVTGLTMDASRRLFVLSSNNTDQTMEVRNASSGTSAETRFGLRDETDAIGAMLTLPATTNTAAAFFGVARASAAFLRTLGTRALAIGTNGSQPLTLGTNNTPAITIDSSQGTRLHGNVGFYNTAPIAKPTVTGSRGGNAALASLLTALANQGLITNSTT